MRAKSNKWKKENSFFLSVKGRIVLNKLCMRCTEDCKQSRKAVLIACPHYKAAK